MDGSIGMVCSQNETWPLAPRVALLSDSSGAPSIPQLVLASHRNQMFFKGFAHVFSSFCYLYTGTENCTSGPQNQP